MDSEPRSGIVSVLASKLATLPLKVANKTDDDLAPLPEPHKSGQRLETMSLAGVRGTGIPGPASGSSEVPLDLLHCTPRLARCLCGLR